ncbi:transporter substrate-binding domain-containing protein [Azospirillum sp. ST 5-10]|uniref:transporter substrate-binding domain-containing protein n=1 Tax=unclassified Azospirillum TaxID=2630922 RepID=UPI003F49E83A
MGAIRLFLTLVLMIPVAACDLPRDPESTLDRVNGGTLRVGVVGAAPWTVVGDGGIGGIEAALVKDLAAELGARVQWVHGSQGELLASLERFDLDLVIGGLTGDSPWKRRVALTRPYLAATTLVGVPPEDPPLDKLDGVEVGVTPKGATAAALEDEGAVPVRVDDLAAFAGPVAAPDWRLAQLGYAVTPHTLATTRHVLAAPPGENAWIVRVERFLSDRAADVRAALAAGGAA